jgi:cytidylate kinase
MASDPETLTQLARLLAEDLPVPAQRSEVQRAVEQRFDRLVDGLVSEAAASDDVFDHSSALEFLEARLSDLRAWLTDDQASRLRRVLQGKIDAW